MNALAVDARSTVVIRIVLGQCHRYLSVEDKDEDDTVIEETLESDDDSVIVESIKLLFCIDNINIIRLSI